MYSQSRLNCHLREDVLGKTDIWRFEPLYLYYEAIELHCLRIAIEQSTTVGQSNLPRFSSWYITSLFGTAQRKLKQVKKDLSELVNLSTAFFPASLEWIFWDFAPAGWIKISFSPKARHYKIFSLSPFFIWLDGFWSSVRLEEEEEDAIYR